MSAFIKPYTTGIAIAVVGTLATVPFSAKPARAACALGPSSAAYGNGMDVYCTPDPPASAPIPSGPVIPKCMTEQNAMRPCDSVKPRGVDPNLVGTWELPVKGGLWVLTINANGTYVFHSDAHDGVPSHAGTFAASNGSWTMVSKTESVKYSGSGNYLYQAPNIFIATFIATNQQGAVAWLRPKLAQAAMQCIVKQQKAVNPAKLDSNLIGTWKVPVKSGTWVWEIAANGNYQFHSEARDGAPSHSGVVTASNGQWTLTATTGLPGYTDNGQYLFQAPNIWMAKGKWAGGAWIRPCNP